MGDELPDQDLTAGTRGVAVRKGGLGHVRHPDQKVMEREVNR
jgi:hypothetical protein